MFLARFSYTILPADRDAAIDLIMQEVEAAEEQGLSARLLVPMTRGAGGPSLQFEVELAQLDQLDTLRHRGMGTEQDTANWADRLSGILSCAPQVELLKVRSTRPDATR
jgi:hypothetical protein